MILSFYSQTCSNDNLYMTTTCLRQPMLSLPKQIPIQSLLHKTTTCLTQPPTTFLVSKMKKDLSKTTTLPSEDMANKHKATMHKK